MALCALACAAFGAAHAQTYPSKPIRMIVPIEPAGSSPAECAKFIQADIAKWAPVVKAGGATAD